MQEKKFHLFRYSNMPELAEAQIMEMSLPVTLPPELYASIEAGLPEGSEARVIFSGFGLSLVHVWFKRHFPLPLHSHNADCVYYIIGGDLRIGTEELRTGDGFFIPAGVPYTYTPGERGVELIEVRNSESFDYREKPTAAFWKKALKTVQENRDNWANARRFLDISDQSLTSSVEISPHAL